MNIEDDISIDVPDGRTIYNQLPHQFADDLALEQCGEAYKGKTYIAAILDASAAVDRARGEGFDATDRVCVQVNALQNIIHDMKDAIGNDPYAVTAWLDGIENESQHEWHQAMDDMANDNQQE